MSKPLDITVTVHTTATPEHVLGAVSDFSDRRARLWPNVKAKHLQVHELGPDFADVTEGIFIVGVFWERQRYDWSESGAVKAVVTDSNVLDPGCRFEIRAAPADGGTDVEMVIHRTFRRNWRGRLGGRLNRLSGGRGWALYLRRVLRAVERETAAAQSGRPVRAYADR